MRFREIEKIILADGWKFVRAKGSHRQYTHPTKPGIVTIPNCRGDINSRIISKPCCKARYCNTIK